MGDFDKLLVLDVLGMALELPSDVEGDVDGRGSDGEGWSNVALQGVAHHQQLVGQDVKMLTELLKLQLGFVTSNLDV